MTRESSTMPLSKEEIIDTLKGLMFGTFDRTTAKERAAFDIAIEALKQEPCEDCISRQAVIELIEKMKPYHQDADDIAEMIVNMPSAQPQLPSVQPKTEPRRKGKWIYDNYLQVDKCSCCGQL